MKKYYYLAVIKPNQTVQEYPVSIVKNGFFNSRYIYRLRAQKFYASRLSYPHALYYKFISFFFPFKEEDAAVLRRHQVGNLVIRTTT